MPQFRYHAFISYSHQDSRWGAWLHKALETYPIPQRLVGRRTAAGTIPKKLAPIFRDRDELPSAHDLGRKVSEALAQSANLVVVCSPHSAASRWVDEEVREFKRLGREERVFCLIVGGEPNASDNVPGNSGGSEAEECFAPALRFQLDADGGLTTLRTEPIAADVRPGKDGKANARLKLVSGLLDVGFDELRQREQQRAHRKLAWVAGLALLGMIVATCLATFALRARDQARFQREQAENLVGFMLGNLREKLEAVNRLDILDEVADHAMGYFDAQEDSGSDANTERAEALLLIGRVRMGQGKYDQAVRAFDESLRVATMRAQRQPADVSGKIAIADARFWLGQVAWKRGDLDTALVQFEAAQPLVKDALAADPGNEEWLARLYWSHNNIGHVLEERGNLDAALREYSAVLELAKRQLALHPADDSLQVQLAYAHDAIGQLTYTQGDLAAAERHYRTEQGLFHALSKRDPRNNGWKQELAFAETFLARVAEARGHWDAANTSLHEALRIGESFLASDPEDTEKIGDTASYCRRLARNLRQGGDAAAAASLLARADALYAQLLAKAPDDTRGKGGQAATWLEQAVLARQAGDAARARPKAMAALDAYAALLEARNNDRSAALGVARARTLLGALDAGSGNADGATGQWKRALDALRPYGADSRDPDELAARAEILHRMGNEADARRIVARLDAIGYRDRDFIAWAKAGPALAPAGKQAH